MRSIAKRLMACEASDKASTASEKPTPFRAFDQLRPHLSMLMGRGGYQALLARALVLATAEVAWLKAVQVVTDGELQGVLIVQGGAETADVSEGEVVLLAQLLGLLVAFIGPALTLRLITQIWPQLPLDDSDFSKTASNEKAK